MTRSSAASTKAALAAVRAVRPVRISPRRTLNPGDRCKIVGHRGTYIYRWQYVDGALGFWGGPKGRAHACAYRPEQVGAIVR